MISEKNLSQKIILVTGAARSGKSEWAETLAIQSGKPVIYIATAKIDANDPEWQMRIQQHQQRRPEFWQTQEVSEDLIPALENSLPPHCLLVDSLGTWVANLLDQDSATWQQTTINLLKSLQKSQVDIIFVAEETGWGVVPAYASGRLFRDRLGKLVRQIAAIADPVYLVTGGYALNLKVLGTPITIDN
jgi:adenosylcobinamide kinase / adenosylcobinamide-phosphate guanylyltransferase